MSTITVNIPRFTDGQPANAAQLNTPLTYIEERLRALYAVIDGDSQRSAILSWGMPCSSDVAIGDLVYFDEDSGVYRKALAAIRTEQSIQSSTNAEASSMVQGMVITKLSDTSAHLLIGGSYTDQALADHCLGAGAVPGIYYLSSSVAGTAEKTFNPLTRQPVLTYLGAGRFTMALFYMAHDDHEHRSYNLTAGWTSCAFDSTSPEGTTYRYNIEDDTALTGVGLEQSACLIFNDGALTADGLYPIIDGQIWYTGSGAPSTTLKLFSVQPFARSNNVLYGISTNDPLTSITVTNGLVKLNKSAYTTSIGVGSRYAVAGVTNSRMVFTPVVSDIEAGPGVFVSVNAIGKALVSLSGFLGAPQEAETINYNGSQPVTDDVYTVTQFPASVDTSVVISNSVRGVAATVALKSLAWLDCVAGAGTLMLQMYFVPEGTDTPQTYRGTPLKTSMTLTAVSDGYVQRFVSDAADALAFSGPGTLITRITADSPNAPIRILRMGHVVYQADNAPTATVSPVTSAESLTASGTAGADLAAGTVVRVSGGSLYPVTNLSPSQAETAVGVVIEACLTGGTATYVTNGVLAGTFTTLTIGAPVYIGVDGVLTTTLPASPAFVQRVGMCISATAVLIDVQSAIMA